MRKTTLASITLVGAVALTMLGAVPANASILGDPANTITVAVLNGGVSITSVVQGTPVPDVTPTSGGGTTASVRALVTVIDSRAAASSWTVGAAASPFVAAAQGVGVTASMADAKVHYTAGAPLNVGVNNAKEQAGVDLNTTPKAVMIASTTSGFNTSVWTADIATTLPTSALLGVYQTTITHSVI